MGGFGKGRGSGNVFVVNRKKGAQVEWECESGLSFKTVDTGLSLDLEVTQWRFSYWPFYWASIFWLSTCRINVPVKMRASMVILPL